MGEYEIITTQTDCRQREQKLLLRCRSYKMLVNHLNLKSALVYLNQELSRTVGDDWMKEVGERREELREKEGSGSVVEPDSKEDFSDQSPRKRISRAHSYHR